MAEAFAPQPQQHEDLGDATPAPDGTQGPGEQELAQLRATAWGEFMVGDTTHVVMTLNTLGRPATERIYGAELVQHVRKLAGGSSLMTIGRR
ncbi:hypothetical protein ACIHCQ_41150 [Streptomyces sp. NPDC052236]|uniref:hypothetical protein n=1 Tax=Streptomyces sp. NPDC052236 TaxID=3365686 RepID=UPI0037CF8BE6